MRRIFRYVLALLLAPGCLLAAGAAAQPAWSINPNSAPTPADRAAIVNLGWPAARDALAAALTKSYVPGTESRAGSSTKPAFQSWILLWRWCDFLAQDQIAASKMFVARHLFSKDGGQTFYIAYPGESPPKDYLPLPLDAALDHLTGSAFTPDLHFLAPVDAPAPQAQPLAALIPAALAAEWLNDPDFLRLFFTALSPGDNPPAVLSNLVALRQSQPPAKFREYRALAIALAVVFDEKFPAYWPHRQVAQDLVPLALASLPDRFAFWIKSNESGALLTNLRQLSPELLKFVVDAPLAESELIWAQKNVARSRSDFGNVFGDVAYDHPRFLTEHYVWDTGVYTLANIKKTKGICVDQAYFAAIAGKARGLPTLFFDGLGSDGAHAWFGFLRDANSWALDCGRYANQNFVTGAALDPQTWTRITDHELLFLTEFFHSQPPYASSRDDLAMAGIFATLGDSAREAKALESAIAVCPRNVEAWNAKTDFLEQTKAPVATLRAHHEAAAKQFANVPDLRAEHQTALIALAEKQGDHAAAAQLQSQISAQNQSGRADLSVEVEAGKIADLIKAGDLAGATREFLVQAPTLGHNAGMSLYTKLTVPLVSALATVGDQGRAQSIIDLTRQILKPPITSQLDTDLTRLQQSINSIPHNAASAPAK